MGLFTKKEQTKQATTPIKDNSSIVLEDKEQLPVQEEKFDSVYDKDEEFSEEENDEQETEENLDEEDVEEDLDENSKDVIWVRQAISYGYDEKKILSILKNQKRSAETIEKILSIYNRLIEENDDKMPLLEEETEEAKTAKPMNDEFAELKITLDAIISNIDARLNKIESYLFRSLK